MVATAPTVAMRIAEIDKRQPNYAGASVVVLIAGTNILAARFCASQDGARVAIGDVG